MKMYNKKPFLTTGLVKVKLYILNVEKLMSARANVTMTDASIVFIVSKRFKMILVIF